MRKFCISCAIMAALLCSNALAANGELLNGKWTSKIMTAVFDVNAGTYNVVALGKESTQKLTIVSDDGNTIVFKSDDKTITATVNSPDSITMVKAGGMPVHLTRVK